MVRTVRTIIAEHLDGRRDHALPLWSLMTLELWARQFLDGAPATTAWQKPEQAVNG